MTLLTLVSKQVWPQILAILHYRPNRVILAHTDEASESRGPAERLRDFLRDSLHMPEGSVELVPIPHDEFRGVVEGLATVADRLSLDAENCRLHFTGGNKLMALAAVEWCRLAETPCFYLERDLRVFPFLSRGAELSPQEPFQLDVHLARSLPPLALLCCQLGSAEVTGSGQHLTLNKRGESLPEIEFGNLLRQETDFRKFLNWDIVETEERPGNSLEFATAVALLRLGVPVVQRSVRLVPRVFRGSGWQEGELDLIFNWAGKLWVVDCKDRHSAATKVDQLRTEILRQTTPDRRLNELLDKFGEELRSRDLHPLKEDLLAVAEAGGLLGRAICVRREPLPTQAAEFADSRHLSVVMRDRLITDLRRVLFPKGAR